MTQTTKAKEPKTVVSSAGAEATVGYAVQWLQATTDRHASTQRSINNRAVSSIHLIRILTFNNAADLTIVI